MHMKLSPAKTVIWLVALCIISGCLGQLEDEIESLAPPNPNGKTPEETFEEELVARKAVKDFLVAEKKLEPSEEQLKVTQPVKKPQFVPLGRYQKAVTQFDGVLKEEVVTYLKLSKDQGVRLPVMSTGIYNKGLDFTVMLWFKVTKGSIEQNELMYLFNFEGSVSCYFTKSRTLMCDSSNRQKLQVDVTSIHSEKWIHLTLSGYANGNAYLQLSDHHEKFAFKRVKDFYLKQTRRNRWRTCIGDCKTNYGFIGGVREYVFLHKYLKPAQAFNLKNMQMTYSPKFKAYYRFANQDTDFARDEFVYRQWDAPPKGNKKQIVGTDLIANDICPYTHKIAQFGLFRQNVHKFRNYELAKTLPQNNYKYSVSLTFMAKGEQCRTRIRSQARSRCHLFEINELFMIYYYSTNMARVHFFNRKRYSEHQSSLFFVPNNQWINLQLTVSHYQGYKIVLTDSNGNTFYQKQVGKNMRSVVPTKKVSAFAGFSGYIDNFKFCDSAYNLPKDPKSMRHCQINVNLKGMRGPSFKNQGSAVDFTVSNAVDLYWVPYRINPPSRRQVKSAPGTFSHKSLFDGIACNDGFRTLTFDDKKSSVQFKTLALKEWMSEITVEFWFKLRSEESYDQSAHIFSLYDMKAKDREKRTFFEIFIKGGELVCAPFGTGKVNNPKLTFKSFKLTKQDEVGWWHVSCSYSFQKLAKASLYNSGDVNDYKKGSLAREDVWFPKSSLIGIFGASKYVDFPGVNGMMIKEFRLWTEQRTKKKLAMHRNSQLDPSSGDNARLLHYLRFGSANYNHRNFARFNENFDYKNLQDQVKMRGISYIEDVNLKEVYAYEKNLKKVVAIQKKIHHTVCPLYTYYMDNKCYREPINKLTLAVYPIWDKEARLLKFDFNTHSSSLINKDLIHTMVESWNGGHSLVLQKAFDDHEGPAYSRLVSQEYLRNEGSYNVSTQLENHQKTFLFEEQMHFIPQFCRWFIVSGYDAKTYKNVLGVENGLEDINFILELQKHPELNCNGFRFFDKFASISFDFLITDTANFIEKKPNMSFSLFNPSLSSARPTRRADGTLTGGSTETVDPMADDLRIRVTLPKAEQYKLPANKDIGILMTIQWTSSRFQEMLSQQETLKQKPVFQNVLYTLKFAPKTNELVTELILNTRQAIRGQDVVLDASGSYVTNMPEEQAKRDLSFAWKCPKKFADLCSRSDRILNIAWQDVIDQKLAFEYAYTFEVIITWTKRTGEVEARRLTQKVSWFNAVAPKFAIAVKPTPILSSSKQDTVFSIDPKNFKVNDLRTYDVKWSLEPELKDPSKRTILSYGQLMEVKKGAFAENTAYKVTAMIRYKSLGALKATSTISFDTKAPPKGGTVSIQPIEGVLGQPFTVQCNGWRSSNPPIVYNVFTTNDIRGTKRADQINQAGPIPITELFQFKVTRNTPVLVEVTDDSGERYEKLLKIKVSLEEKWFDFLKEKKNKKGRKSAGAGEGTKAQKPVKRVTRRKRTKKVKEPKSVVVFDELPESEEEEQGFEEESEEIDNTDEGSGLEEEPSVPEFDEDSESDEESGKPETFVVDIEPDAEAEDFVDDTLPNDELEAPSAPEESEQIVLELPDIEDMNRPDMTAQEDPNAEQPDVEGFGVQVAEETGPRPPGQSEIYSLFQKSDKTKDGHLYLGEFKQFLVNSLIASSASVEDVASLKNQPMSFFEQAFFDKDTDWDKKLSWLEVWESTDQSGEGGADEEERFDESPPEEPEFSDNDVNEDEWEDMDESGEQFMDEKLNSESKKKKTILSFVDAEGRKNMKDRSRPKRTIIDESRIQPSTKPAKQTPASVRKSRLNLRYVFDEADIGPRDQSLSKGEFESFLVTMLRAQRAPQEVIEKIVSPKTLRVVFNSVDSNESNRLTFPEVWTFYERNDYGKTLIDQLTEQGQIPEIIVDPSLETRLNMIFDYQDVTESADLSELRLTLKKEPETRSLQKMVLIERILNKIRDMEPTEVLILKKELLDSISAQIQVQGQSNLSVRRFLEQSVAVIWRLLEPAQIDEEILQKAMKLLDHQLMKKGRGDVFRNSFLQCLEQINKLTRTAFKSHKPWLASKVQQQADQVCRDESLGSRFNYDGAGEIGIQIGKFDPQHSNFRLSALDASYLVKPHLLSQEIPNFEGPLCAQFTIVRGGVESKRFEGYSRGVTSLTLLNPETNQHHKLEELVNYVEITFAISPTTYAHNQTICVARQGTENWKADSCLTKVIPESFTIRCQCSSIVSDEIALVTDLSRVAVHMPEFEQLRQIEAVSTGHVACFLSLLVFIVGVLSACAARMNDKQDWERLTRISTEASAKGLQTEALLQNTATILNEPISTIRARRSELLSYTSLWHQSAFINTLQKVHPIYAPFASFRLQVSRLVRFSAYQLQINLVLIAIIGVFSTRGSAPKTDSVELNEIQKVFYISMLMSVLLLPIASEPIIWQFDTPRKGEISAQSVTWGRITFVAATQVSGVLVIVFTALYSNMITMAAQYCIVSCFLLTLFLGTFITNMARVYLSMTLSPHSSRLARAFTARQATEVRNDMEAVKQAETMCVKCDDSMPAALEQNKKDIAYDSNVALKRNTEQGLTFSQPDEEFKSSRKNNKSLGAITTHKSTVQPSHPQISHSKTEVKHTRYDRVKDNSQAEEAR